MPRQAVAARGYRLLYLSARPFTFYPSTASYIRSLRGLPAGPLLLDPHSTLRKLKRLRSPDEQKIEKLTEIGNLFPGGGADGGGPFFAGYGNKETDKRAYERVGIDEGRIFRVDKKSRRRGRQVHSAASNSCAWAGSRMPKAAFMKKPGGVPSELEKVSNNQV